MVTGDAGGTWSGAGVTGTTFNGAGLGAGTYTVTYTVTSTDPACADDSSTQNISVITCAVECTNPTDASTTAPSGAVCNDEGTTTLNLSSLVTGDAGGTWSGAGVSGTTFNGASLAAGTYTVTYTVTSTDPACADDSSTQSITVEACSSCPNPPSAATTAPSGAVCNDEGTTTLNLSSLVTGNAGGTWSGTGVSGNTFNALGLGAGTYTVTYSVSLAGCPDDSSTQTISVVSCAGGVCENPPNASTNQPSSTVCFDTGTTTLNLNTLITGDTGGSWSGAGVTGATFNGASVGAGFFVLTYTVTSSDPDCAPASSNVTVNVVSCATCTNPADASTTAPSGTVCNDEGSTTINLSSLVTGDFGGTWTGAGVNGSTFNAIGLTPGSYTLTYAVVSSDPNCPIESTSQTVTVVSCGPTCTNPPNAATMPATSSLCNDTAPTSLDLNSLVTGDLGGTWSGTGVSGNMFNATGLGIGSYTVTYTVTAPACPTATSSQTITVTSCANLPPDLSGVVDVVNVTEGGSIGFNLLNGATDPENDNLTLTNVSGGAAIGTITFNADGSVTFTLNGGVTGGSATLTYTVSDGTNTSTGTVLVVVSECEANAGSLDFDEFVCAKDEAILLSASGQNTAYIQAYIIADASGTIIGFSDASTGVVENPEPGVYTGYAVNFDPNDAPNYGLGTNVNALLSGTADGCYALSNAGSIRVLDHIAITHDVFCDPAVGGSYFVNVQVTGGFPAYAGAGSYSINFPPNTITYSAVTGNAQVVIGPVPEEACFYFDVDNDGLLCDLGSYYICGMNCDVQCMPVPGTMTPNSTFVCAGGSTNLLAQGSEVKPEFNEVGAYVIHSAPVLNDTNILAVSSNGIFQMASIPGAQYNTNYYASFVVGNAADVNPATGIPNLNDPTCTGISNSVPVVFLAPIVIDYETVCDEENEEYSVVIHGISGGYPDYDTTASYTLSGAYNGQVDNSIIIGPIQPSVFTITASDLASCAATVSEDVSCKPMPIELVDFSGEVLEEGNLLKWITAVEIDNDYFTVYRSVDGVAFEAVGEVDGAGNSIVTNTYNLLDKEAPAGLSFYRLDQTDYDGTTTSSEVITLVRGEQAFGITSVTPIPAIEFIDVVFTSDVKTEVSLTIYNVAGALVHTRTMDANNGLNTIKINVANYATGVYFLAINNGQEVQNIKFVKD